MTSSYPDGRNPDLSGTLCREVGLSDEFMTDIADKHEPLVRILTNSVSSRLPKGSECLMSLKSHIEDFRKYQDELYRVMNLTMIFTAERTLELNLTNWGVVWGDSLRPEYGVIKEQRR